MESELSNNGYLRQQIFAAMNAIVLIIIALQSAKDQSSFTKVFQKYSDLVSNAFRIYFKIKSFSSKNKIMPDFYKNPEEKLDIKNETILHMRRERVRPRI